MANKLELYADLQGKDVINQLTQISKSLQGKRIVHVNSTRFGGGVAEILDQFVPLTTSLGIQNSWEVIGGDADFFQCTKMFHNAIQGKRTRIPTALLHHFEEVNKQNAEQLRPILEDADVVVIHDPQPSPLINHFPNRKGKWIWRCHVDVSNPDRFVWKYLKQFVQKYDASVFSLADFAQPLPHKIFLIPPSIDPFSDKNIGLTEEEINSVYSQFNIDPTRPIILQVSRFDVFKDPIGVIEAYKLAKKFKPGLQLILAGGGAPDDPEGEAVLNAVRSHAGSDPDLHILMLPADAHRTINALQRAADIVLQKSIKEGFGLTVTEALWKGKPVIGGNTGGIRLQVINDHTGFLVNSPEGAANRIRYLFENPEIIGELGRKGKQYVLNNFLLTRQLREYLTMMVTLISPETERIEFARHSA